MIRLFTGYDFREAVGWGAFAHSVMQRTSQPVALIPLSGPQADGSNAFTYARFLVPKLCEYEGWAIFADGSDMVCLADIAELWALRDTRYAVQVVKHAYQPKSAVKYVGTPMECRNVAYAKKNWSSLVLWNCAHPKAKYQITESSLGLHQFQWLAEEDIGELPIEWNWLCDEYGGNPEAKILHWTCGIPAFWEYRETPMASAWFAEYWNTQAGLQLEKGVAV